MKYSQSNEEEHILNYFGDYVGTFLSIGENDGVTFSNVRALALRGWKGYMIEPSPKAFRRLKVLYNGHKNFKLYDFAISDHNGKAMLQESGSLCSPADVGLVSTFHSHEKERFARSVRYESVEVKCFKWKTAINRWTTRNFEMISIDCEGDELNILPDMDLSKTRLICIEWNSKPVLKDAYLRYTSVYGLNKILYESGENLIIVR